MNDVSLSRDLWGKILDNICDNMALEEAKAVLSEMQISLGMCRDKLPAIFLLFPGNPQREGMEMDLSWQGVIKLPLAGHVMLNALPLFLIT